MTNDYDIVITQELIVKGERAVALAKQAAEAWYEFETAATGQEGAGTAGGSLERAVEDAEDDLTRFTSGVEL